MHKHLCGSVLLLLVAPLPGYAAPLRQSTKVLANDAATAFSDRQVHAYASALLEIEKMKRAVQFRAAKLSIDQAALLKSRASAETMNILARHGLDVETFNQISAKVDKQGRLRHKVKQLMMEEQLSI
ncbi:DUF4168 domain-containing protein [Sphingobium sp. SJ10-10]|uniref:DUF4168 domain-containing protein n=1 Tax=unclassified Sphingobium TaxID=2611147 RepID=UPI000C20ECFB|nr:MULTISPECIES: DUF4168 domain-containing protein [unclassified Sphingobium]MEC6698126.1 DUF4168 domain-containing protein [Sphingobium sp. SJ10-10]PJG48897.1 hypothetical protein CAF53_12115 [Sphingobium sp. LB126]